MIKYLLIATTQVDPVCWVFLEESDSDRGTGGSWGHNTLFILVKQSEATYVAITKPINKYIMLHITQC